MLKRIVIGLAAVALLAQASAKAQTASVAPQAADAPLTFRQALDLATVHNLSLAAVRRGRAIREADLRAAGQLPNPEFAADITKDVPHGDLSVAFPLDLGRTRSRRMAIAREGIAMADVDEKTALVALRHSLRLAFYGLMAAGQEASLAEDVMRVADRVREAAQARFEEGAAPKLEVMQADLGVARANADRDLARANRRAAQAELNALLNRPPGLQVVLAGELADIPPLPTLDRATAQATTANVELLSLDREASLEDKTLGLLKAERIPQPTFSFGTAINAPGEFNVGPHAGISFSLPLFSRNQGEIAGSTAKSEQIRARRESVRHEVESRVFAAVEHVTALRAQVETYRTTLVPAATALQSLAEESYRLGRSSILAALDAQRSLRDVKYDYVQALVSLQAAVADLEDILGGPIL
jgi:cobalt-zinc-cadmium efflux system outer membrane protein